MTGALWETLFHSEQPVTMQGQLFPRLHSYQPHHIWSGAGFPWTCWNFWRSHLSSTLNLFLSYWVIHRPFSNKILSIYLFSVFVCGHVCMPVCMCVGQRTTSGRPSFFFFQQVWAPGWKSGSILGVEAIFTPWATLVAPGWHSLTHRHLQMCFKNILGETPELGFQSLGSGGEGPGVQG